MRNAWTGGQYSLFRLLFAAYLLVHFLELVPYAAELFSNEGVIDRASASPLIGVFPNLLGVFDGPRFVTAFVLVGALFTIPFGLGLFDRIASIVLWYVWACLFGRNPLIANPGLPYIGWMLIAHAFLPPAPYGSWRARGRPDPGNDWRMPPPIFMAAWFLMAAGYTFSGVTKLVSPSWVDGTAVARVLESPLARPTFLREMVLALPQVVLRIMSWPLLAFELAFLPLAAIRRVRPFLWLAMVAMHLGILTFVAFADLTFGMLILHLFTVDPDWIRPLHADRTERIYYDGFCGLCHRTIRMVLAEDRSGTSFRFAALQSEAFEREVPPDRRAGLPDSVIVRCSDGTLLVKSTAILYLGKRMGGAWRVLATAFELIPLGLRDACYDFIARVRHRVFARPKEVCPIVPKHLSARFDP